MKKEDFLRFGAAMMYLAGKYPTQVNGCTSPRALDPAWLQDYFEVLDDLPIERVEAGTKWHYGHSEFFPDHPAALRKSIGETPWDKVAIPPSQQIALDTPDERETPHEEAVVRLMEIFNRLNGRFGTHLDEGVETENGRNRLPGEV